MSGFREGQFDCHEVPSWARGFCPAHSSLSLLDIDPAILAKNGKKLLLLDVDNTLLPWRSETIPPSSFEWVEAAKRAGLKLCILSNTRHPARLDRIAKRVDVPYLTGKFKPSPSMYRQALKQFSVSPQEAVMIGDQLFTDILGANRSGIEAIWVRPMTGRDFVGTKLSRLGERIVRPTLYKSLRSEDMEETAELPPGGAGAIELMKRPVVRQFVKFCIVGGTSTVIDLGLHGFLLFILTVGNETFGVVFGRFLMESMPWLFGFAAKPIDAAVPVLKVFTASLAILNSFYWNRRWTFSIRGKEERLRQLQKFVAVAVMGMILNTIITTALYNIVPGHPRRSWAIASAVATIAVAFWNFSGQKLWTFRKKAE
ncbi:MAG TPA: YqeG family HAD IIIA-type phosphatase [Fimbriimonadaceae bacterium]|nr:YqeG family HAD IIIA-type phosphatase [Fimbriimonadaceae bacterium]